MTVRFTRPAETDLVAIFEYFAEAEDVKLARQVIARIRDQAAVLDEHSKIGRGGRVEPTRELVLRPYPFVLVYELVDIDAYVLRVLHQRQQWP